MRCRPDFLADRRLETMWLNVPNGQIQPQKNRPRKSVGRRIAKLHSRPRSSAGVARGLATAINGSVSRKARTGYGRPNSSPPGWKAPWNSVLQRRTRKSPRKRGCESRRRQGRFDRCAVQSGAARAARKAGNFTALAPGSLGGSAMFDSIELVDGIEHGHDIFHRRGGLNVVNRVEHESTVGWKNSTPAGDPKSGKG